jgi:hypothetical protein
MIPQKDWEIQQWNDFDLILGKVIGQDNSHSPFALSLDATTLAWISEERELCLHIFSEKQTQCQPIPESFKREAIIISFLWSPDKRHIAFNLDGYGSPEPSSVWVYSLSSKEYKNVTEFVGEDLGFSIHINYSLQWESNNRNLYFLQHKLDNTPGIWKHTSHLYTFQPGHPTPELLFELPQSLAASDLTLVAVSPDNQHLALLVNFVIADADKAMRGLWIFDLKNNMLNHAARIEDLRMGVPPAYSVALGLDSATWNEDGLLIKMSHDPYVPRVVATYFEPVTETLVPLFDLISASDDPQTLTPFGEPQLGDSTQDGKFFFYITAFNGEQSLWLLPLPPNGSKPFLIKEDFRLKCGTNHYLVTIEYEGKVNTSLLEFSVGCG